MSNIATTRVAPDRWSGQRPPAIIATIKGKPPWLALWQQTNAWPAGALSGGAGAHLLADELERLGVEGERCPDQRRRGERQGACGADRTFASRGLAVPVPGVIAELSGAPALTHEAKPELLEGLLGHPPRLINLRALRRVPSNPQTFLSASSQASPPGDCGAHPTDGVQEHPASRQWSCHRDQLKLPGRRSGRGVRTRMMALIPVHPDRHAVERADPRHRRTLRSQRTLAPPGVPSGGEG